MIESSQPLNVVLFSGGRGTTSISDALLKYGDINLTMLVNAYDDGLSTGLIRRFIPGLLGPSDIRKVISSVLKHQTDQSSAALRLLLEHRLPDPIDTEQALQLLNSLINWHLDAAQNHELLAARESLTVRQSRQASAYLAAFTEHYHATIKERPWFTFADNSVGNILFGGCFLLNNRDFNQTIAAFAAFAGIEPGLVINVTGGENLVLVGIKEDGRFLADEASIVSPQDANRIEEIFLLPNYLDQRRVEALTEKNERIAFLRNAETLPSINPMAAAVLRQADIIIYGPGTQHSSLYPSYLTVGVAEAVTENKHAEKIFIANIARDHDILAENATTLVRGLVDNMSRKKTYPVKSQQLVTRFFFQKPEPTNNETNYLPFEGSEFDHPIDQVVWVDLEGDKGKHAGGRTVAELMHIVETRLRRRVRHVPHKVSIIIPALNEQRTIKKVIQAVKDAALPNPGLEKEIIVIDGGSTDKTRSIVEGEPGVRLYQVTGKKGRGAALRLGIEKAKGDIIVFFPSDHEYAATDITRVVAPLLSQEFPIVFGSRAFSGNLSGTLERIYGGKGARFAVSKYGGMLLSMLTLLLYQRYVGDPLTSVKGFHARVFRQLAFTRTGVDFDMELVAKMARSGYSILEVPVSYKARTVKEGKKITVEDGVACLFALLRFATHKPKNAQS